MFFYSKNNSSCNSVPKGPKFWSYKIKGPDNNSERPTISADEFSPDIVQGGAVNHGLNASFSSS
jgi:hypothetical protein